MRCRQYVVVVLFASLSILISGCGDIPTSIEGVRAFLSQSAGPGYDLGFTHYDCIHNIMTDADGDGIDDACENAIAAAFVPKAIFHEGTSCASREDRFAIRQADGPAVHILYMIGYHEDCGTAALGPVNLGPHKGDSEFVHLWVREENGRWMLDKAFLSAHYEVRYWFYDFDRSRHVYHNELTYADAPRGRPVIYVARWKHANYESRERCDGVSFDSCFLGLERIEEFLMPATRANPASRNVGTWQTPLIDCVGSEQGYPGTECYWTPTFSFAGWNNWTPPPFVKTMTYHRVLEQGGFRGSQPFPTPSIAIIGPSYGVLYEECTWQVGITGGTTPYSVEWRFNWGTEPISTTTVAQAHLEEAPNWIHVRVWDAYGFEAQDNRDIEIDEFGPRCQDW